MIPFVSLERSDAERMYPLKSVHKRNERFVRLLREEWERTASAAIEEALDPAVYWCRLGRVILEPCV